MIVMNEEKELDGVVEVNERRRRRLDAFKNPKVRIQTIRKGGRLEDMIVERKK